MAPLTAKELLSCRVDFQTDDSGRRTMIVEGDSQVRGQEGVQRLWLKQPDQSTVIGSAEVFRGYQTATTPKVPENEFLILAIRLFSGIDAEAMAELFSESFLNSKALISAMYDAELYLDLVQIVDNRDFSKAPSESVELSAVMNSQKVRVKCRICSEGDC
jgi:hypothetical protein